MFQRIPESVHDLENNVEANKLLIISFMPNILFFFEYPEVDAVSLSCTLETN